MSTINAFMTLDSRKRLNLATIATRDSYSVTREANGRIILEPAVVLTEDELRALQGPETRAAVAKARENAVRLPRRRLS